MLECSLQTSLYSFSAPSPHSQNPNTIQKHQNSNTSNIETTIYNTNHNTTIRIPQPLDHCLSLFDLAGPQEFNKFHILNLAPTQIVPVAHKNKQSKSFSYCLSEYAIRIKEISEFYSYENIPTIIELWFDYTFNLETPVSAKANV